MSELQQRLDRSSSLIALQVQGREASRLLTRDTIVPAGWLALARWSSGQMSVVPAGADIGREPLEWAALFRAGPIAMPMRLHPIRTADGHEAGCTVTLRFAVRPDVNELNGLLKEFLKRSKSEIDLADIEAYLNESALVAARVFARGKPAAEIVAPTIAPPLADHLYESLERPFTSIGLTLVPGMLVQCHLLSEAAAIQFHQPTAPAGSQEILHKALLSQFEDLAAQAAGCGERKVAEALCKLRDKVSGQVAFTTFDQVAQVLPERICAELHEALLRVLAAAPAERALVVAGSQAIAWRLADPAQPAWKQNLPSDLGVGRSVKICRSPQGEPWVLVGCQRGVAVLDAATGRPVHTLLEPYRGYGASQGSGYNAAVLRGRQCWASKSDVGLVCWDLDRPTAPWSVLGAGKGQTARFVRAVTVDGQGLLWLGADNWLVSVGSGLPTLPELTWFVPIDAAVTSVAVDGEDLWVGTQAGGLWRISQDDPRIVQHQEVSPGQALEALTVRRTGPVRWLVCADGTGAVIRSVNGFYARKLTGKGGVRACRIGGTWVAGLNDWRDSLLLWNGSSSGREALEMNIQRLANARIQDFDIG